MKNFNPEIWFERKAFNPGSWLKRQHKRIPVTPNSGAKNQSQIEDEVEIVLQRIENQKIDLTCEYEDWLKLGFAFSNEFGEAGRQYFHRISQFYSDYNPTETDKQYNNCLRAGKSCITIRSFFGAAKDAGINIRV